MKIEIDKRLANKIAGKFERYEFEVGILDDKPHRLAQDNPGSDFGLGKNLGKYAGGPVRKTSRKPSGLSVAEVSRENSKRLGFNYLLKPFQKRNDADILKFANAFMKYALGKGKDKRVTNLMQAIVRNPILRGEYGSNSDYTQSIKGFDRPMIDTGQLFKNIKARVTRRKWWKRRGR